MTMLSVTNSLRALGLGLGLSTLAPLSGCGNASQKAGGADDGTNVEVITPQPPAEALDPCQGANVGVGCEVEKVLPSLFEIQWTAHDLSYTAPDTMPWDSTNVVPTLEAGQARLFMSIERNRFNAVEENGVIRFSAIGKWASDPGPTGETFSDLAINLRKTGASLCDMGYEPLYNGLDPVLGYPFRDIGADPYFFCRTDAPRIGLFYAVQGEFDPNTDTLTFTFDNTQGDRPSEVMQAGELSVFEFYGPGDGSIALGFPQFNADALPHNSALLVYETQAITFDVAGLFTDITQVDEPVSIESEEVTLCSGSACDDLGKQLADSNAKYDYVGGATAERITAQLTSVTIGQEDIGEVVVEPEAMDAGAAPMPSEGDGG